ncbi:hypothetical protein LeptoLang_21505 (plasmid) [Leptospira interrogans serovar Icterohaemorrhagiae]|nr:hypothetical protein [Leptospira interrogans serovar Yeoncheon]QOI36770.1 hypothetical protein LeptoLang_21505 [Leptospira interrogans serovar Icterohaemorrhagiae]
MGSFGKDALGGSNLPSGFATNLGRDVIVTLKQAYGFGYYFLYYAGNFVKKRQHCRFFVI